MPFLPRPPTQSVMAQDLRVITLQQLRESGLRPGETTSWQRLLRCVEELPCLSVSDLPLWSWQALPQRVAQ